MQIEGYNDDVSSVDPRYRSGSGVDVGSSQPAGATSADGKETAEAETDGKAEGKGHRFEFRGSLFVP